jgi:mRNA interferase MazF
VIQNNVFNRSRINTVVVCVMTSNLRRAEAPGNVLLEAGEGNLPKQSVVNVSQLYTVDKRDLVEFSGRLSQQRVRQVLAGVMLVLEPREID